MRVYSCSTKTSFSAKLNENTRTLIKDFDRFHKHNLEGQIDKAIKDSPLHQFCGDKATISFVETENPFCNIAPVVSVELNGIPVSHVLKGHSEICAEQNEDNLFEKMNRRPYRYMNTIISRLNSETISQIKKYLAFDYVQKMGFGFELDNVDENTFDSIFQGWFCK